jgi:hypothetical protein
MIGEDGREGWLKAERGLEERCDAKWVAGVAGWFRKAEKKRSLSRTKWR